MCTYVCYGSNNSSSSNNHWRCRRRHHHHHQQHHLIRTVGRRQLVWCWHWCSFALRMWNVCVCVCVCIFLPKNWLIIIISHKYSHLLTPPTPTFADTRLHPNTPYCRQIELFIVMVPSKVKEWDLFFVESVYGSSFTAVAAKWSAMK